MAYDRVEIMPWERVDKAYVFEAPNGRVSLSELLAGRGQLVIYRSRGAG